MIVCSAWGVKRQLKHTNIGYSFVHSQSDNIQTEIPTCVMLLCYLSNRFSLLNAKYFKFVINIEHMG